MPQLANSLALCYQIRTISGVRVHSTIGRLADKTLRRRVAEALLDHLEMADLEALADEP